VNRGTHHFGALGKTTLFSKLVTWWPKFVLEAQLPLLPYEHLCNIGNQPLEHEPGGIWVAGGSGGHAGRRRQRRPLPMLSLLMTFLPCCQLISVYAHMTQVTPSSHHVYSCLTQMREEREYTTMRACGESVMFALGHISGGHYSAFEHF
jgi:hypothetical protein